MTTQVSSGNYTGPMYDAVTSVRNMRQTPRFGHTSEFAKLFSYDSDEQVDYAMGQVFISTFLFLFFFFWTITIIVFKCMGPKQVGFLSGHHFVQPDPRNDLSMVKPYKRPFRVRLTFLNCALLVILFTVLMVVNGFKNLDDTVSSADTSNTEIKKLVEESYSIADSLVEIGEASIFIRNRVVQELGDFCPDNPDIEQQTGVDFDEIARDAIVHLQSLENFIENDVAEFRDDLDQVAQATRDVDDVLDSTNIEDWKVMLFAIPLVVLPAILAVGTVMAWTDVSCEQFQCFLTWGMLPLFVICIVFCWVACSAFAVSAVMNADFCSGGNEKSPDETFIQILHEQDYNTQGLIYKSVFHYVKGCRSEFPFDFINDYEAELNDGVTSVEELINNINTVTVATLTSICGKNFEPIMELLETMHLNLQKLDGNAELALKLLACSRINPIYVTAIHDGTCTYSVTGFTWIFSSLLIISVCGMLMITFRASWLDAEYIEPTCRTAEVMNGLNQNYSGSKDDEYDEHDEPNRGETASFSDNGEYSPQDISTSTSQYEMTQHDIDLGDESTETWEKYPSKVPSQQDAVLSPPQSD